MLGGKKFDKDKLPIHLVPYEAIQAIAVALNYGKKKYGERNWEQGIEASRLFSATQRHLWAWWSGEDKDKESGLNPLYHAICDLAMLIALLERKMPIDDRPSSKKELKELKEISEYFGNK